jgi:CheY-like chemotaxis protein
MAHVLVVDDVPAIRELLEDILTDAGHAVGKVTDGQQVLDFLRSTSHRWVVVLDSRMPGVDGLTVLETVATDASLARRHAYIAVSATPRLDAPVASRQAALGIPLLPKPFDLDQLFRAIAQAEARLAD